MREDIPAPDFFLRLTAQLQLTIPPGVTVDLFILCLGTAMIVVGTALLAYGRSAEGRNSMRVLGLEFNLSHPSLVVVVLGFCLVLFKIGGIKPASSTDTSPGQGVPVRQSASESVPAASNPCDDPAKKDLFACLPEK